MKEILMMAAPVLILASFLALIAFYSFVFWHWQNDRKRRDARRASSPNRLTGDRTRAPCRWHLLANLSSVAVHSNDFQENVPSFACTGLRGDLMILYPSSRTADRHVRARL